MTEQEAIEYLNNHYLVVGHILNPPKKECEHHNSVMDMAIQALEEIEQYRSIGTVEEFKALKEKAEPKKDNNDGGRCKACGTYNNFIINKLANPKGHPVIYCWNCGQAIDWT